MYLSLKFTFCIECKFRILKVFTRVVHKGQDLLFFLERTAPWGLPWPTKGQTEQGRKIKSSKHPFVDVLGGWTMVRGCQNADPSNKMVPEVFLAAIAGDHFPCGSFLIGQTYEQILDSVWSTCSAHEENGSFQGPSNLWIYSPGQPKCNSEDEHESLHRDSTALFAPNESTTNTRKLNVKAIWVKKTHTKDLHNIHKSPRGFSLWLIKLLYLHWVGCRRSRESLRSLVTWSLSGGSLEPPEATNFAHRPRQTSI